MFRLGILEVCVMCRLGILEVCVSNLTVYHLFLGFGKLNETRTPPTNVASVIIQSDSTL